MTQVWGNNDVGEPICLFDLVGPVVRKVFSKTFHVLRRSNFQNDRSLESFMVVVTLINLWIALQMLFSASPVYADEPKTLRNFYQELRSFELRSDEQKLLFCTLRKGEMGVLISTATGTLCHSCANNVASVDLKNPESLDKPPLPGPIGNSSVLICSIASHDHTILLDENTCGTIDCTQTFKKLGDVHDNARCLVFHESNSLAKIVDLYRYRKGSTSITCGAEHISTVSRCLQKYRFRKLVEIW